MFHGLRILLSAVLLTAMAFAVLGVVDAQHFGSITEAARTKQTEDDDDFPGSDLGPTPDGGDGDRPDLDSPDSPDSDSPESGSPDSDSPESGSPESASPESDSPGSPESESPEGPEQAGGLEPVLPEFPAPGQAPGPGGPGGPAPEFPTPPRGEEERPGAEIPRPDVVVRGGAPTAVAGAVQPPTAVAGAAQQPAALPPTGAENAGTSTDPLPLVVGSALAALGASALAVLRRKPENEA